MTAENPRNCDAAVGVVFPDDPTALAITVRSIQPWSSRVVVAVGRPDEFRAVVASRLGCRTIVVPEDLGFGEARNRVMTAAQGKWMFWLAPGETVSKEVARRICELVRMAPADAPDAYTVEVHQPGEMGDSTLGMLVADQTRLHQTTDIFRFRNMASPSLSHEVMAAATWLVWTNLAVCGARPRAQVVHDGLDRQFIEGDARCNPRDPYCQFSLGARLAKAGQTQAAMDALKRYFRLAPAVDTYRTAANLWLARCQRMTGDYPSAKDALECAKASGAANAELCFEQGILHQCLRQFQRAIACYVVCKQGSRARDFQWFDSSIVEYRADHNMAAAYVQLGDHPRAEAIWADLVQRVPRFRAAQIALGDLYVSIKAFDRARARADQMIKEPSLRVDSLLLHAEIAQAQGELADARRHLEAAVRCSPQELRPIQQLAEFFGEFGPDEEIQPALEEISRRAPDQYVTHYNLAVFYQRRGRHEDAIRGYLRCLELNPRCRQAYVNIGYAYQQVGRRKDARDAWEKAKSHRAATADGRSVSSAIVDAQAAI